MSDVELLFLVLALIYVWECSNWVPLGAIAFTTWLGSRWRRASPAVRNQKGGFVLAPFLPPLGGIVSANPPPLLISPEGFLAARPPSAKGEVIALAWTDLRKIEAEGKLLAINGKAFARAFTITQARQAVDEVRNLLRLAPAARESALQKLMHDRFRSKTALQKWKAFSLRTANLQFLANVLLIYLFVFAPLAIGRMGLTQIWPSLLAGLYVLTFSIAFMFHSAHKHFYPAAKDERFTHTLINMFSPATTIRARDLLSRPLLENFHPVALAKAFCRESEFKAMARAAVLDFHFPAKSTVPSATAPAIPQAVVRYCRELEKKALETFLQKHGLKIADLLQPPRRMDESCVAYCPRCQAQFTFVEGECSDCGGIKLQPFTTSSRQKAEPIASG